MKDILSKFKYVAYTGCGKSVHDNIPQWEKYLGVTIHNTNSQNRYYFVEIPEISRIKECIRLLNEDEYILTDCRFFALFTGCLLLKKKLFHMIKTPVPEAMVPDNCHYMTLDLKYFVIKKETDNPVILSHVLGDLNGQWLVKVPQPQNSSDNDDQTYYLGIGSTKLLHMSMTDWIAHYKKNIEDRLKELREKKKKHELSIRNISLLRLLDIYIKKHGLIVNIYKKSEKNNYMNIKISQI